MKTFLNSKGEPMIRSCMSCLHFDKLMKDGVEKDEGYCKLKKLLYAYTMKESVYALVKKYYLCIEHRFKNEEKLINFATPIDQLEALKLKEK